MTDAPLEPVAETAATIADGNPPRGAWAAAMAMPDPTTAPFDPSIRDAIGIAVEKVLASGLVEKTLEDSIGKCVESALKSMTGEYSEFGKALKQQLAAALNCGTDLGLPSYGHTLLQIVQKQVNETLNGHLYAAVQKTLADLLETPPATIKLTDLVARCIDYYGERRHRDGSNRITLRVVPGCLDGYQTICLDPKEGRGEYQCLIRMSVDRDNRVYALQLDGAQLEEKLFVGNLRKFEKFLFQLFICKTPIEFDADPDDIDTSYPDASD